MITIGITTFNRKHILQRMAHSLYGSNLLYDCNIRIYDDSSSEFDETYLKELFPDSKSIYIQKNNMGSDGNIRFMYEDFLNSDDKYFFNADSDLLFHKDWIQTLMRVIDDTDGVLSAFNANHPKRHKQINQLCLNGIDIIEKETIGSAGTLFTRECLEMIVNRLDSADTNSFDWKWTALLRKEGKKIYTLKDSMVQHIGFMGFNGFVGNFDYGKSFIIDSIYNGQAINDVIENIAASDANTYRNSYALFPFSEIEKGARIVIYGAGKYGMDYFKQVKSIDYCEVQAICDANYYDMDGITDPHLIKKMDYDYIVISIGREDIVEEVKSFLYEMGVKADRIIDRSWERIIKIN